jgi:putative ABC transport system permease protein
MRDVRYAVRFLWAHKSFTAAAVLTLAIGLGANTAFYGLLNAALRPLDLPHPEQLVAIAADSKDDDTGGFQYTFSPEQLKDLQDLSTPFSAVVGITQRIGGLSADGRASQFWFAAVSDNYFTGLGVTPALGQLFTQSAGAPAHVVLGHSYWLKVFGGDPNVIGRPVRIDGQPAVITGVVPESFHGTLMAVEMDGYVALDDLGVVAPDVKRWLYHNRKARNLQVFARLKPGVGLGEAQAATNVLMASLEVAHPDTDKGVGARVMPEPLARPLPMPAVSRAIPLVQFFGLAIAGMVLLLACMNVANLLLVRATAREREMAVRAALGASRGRLIKQMVTEGLMLSGLGGVAGYALGWWVTTAFVARIDLGADLPMRLDVRFDTGVFLFALGTAILTGVVIGLWPAWRASRADARAALHDGGRGHSDGADRQRLRRVLVVGQVSGSLALLVVAGLFVRSLVSARQIDLGFDAEHLITVRIDPKQIGYDEDRTNEFFKELQRRVAAWPDVASVAIAFTTPMSYLLSGGALYVEGQPLPASGQPPASFLNRVGHNYFDTMRIPIVRGRAFVEDDEHERATTRKIAIVNEAMAAKYWPGQDPIGKRFQLFNPAEPMLEVVGVAKDSKYVLIFESPRPYLYLPIERDTTLRTLHVRTAGPPALLGPRLEHEINELAPGLPIADLRTLNQSLAGIFGFLIFRVGAIQAGGMGLLGLVLAIIGVYGVVSFGASLRTREIGIRVALGAQSATIRRMVLRQGMSMTAPGMAIGLAGALVTSRVMASMLFHVPPADPMILAGSASCLALVAALAAYFPARRATSIDPRTALQ